MKPSNLRRVPDDHCPQTSTVQRIGDYTLMRPIYTRGRGTAQRAILLFKCADRSLSTGTIILTFRLPLPLACFDDRLGVRGDRALICDMRRPSLDGWMSASLDGRVNHGRGALNKVPWGALANGPRSALPKVLRSALPKVF